MGIMVSELLWLDVFFSFSTLWDKEIIERVIRKHRIIIIPINPYPKKNVVSENVNNEINNK